MKKSGILFLTQSYPPRSGAAGRRLKFLAEKAKEVFREVLIIRIDRGYPEQKQPGVRTFTIPAQDLRQMLSPAAISMLTKPASWSAQLRYARQSFPFVYLGDDGGKNYRKRAHEIATELLARYHCSTIISSFRPWSDHLVAARLKREFPHLHWIADFRDLPVDPVRRDVWFAALQRWWGRRVIADADEVWCVSRGQQAQFARQRIAARVVRNPLLEMPPDPPVIRSRAHFSLVYTGSLYSRLQSLDSLLGALHNLLDAGHLNPAHLRLVYRGKDPAIFRSWVESLPPQCLDIQPSIAPAAARKLQRQATVLVLLNWSAPGYEGVLTAKLWDYLAAGRPIMALVNGPMDTELQHIIQGAAAGAVFTTEEQSELESRLLTWYRQWQSNGLLWEPNRQALTQYLRVNPFK